MWNQEALMGWKPQERGKGHLIAFNLIVFLLFFKLILTTHYLCLKTKRGKKEKRGEGMKRRQRRREGASLRGGGEEASTRHKAQDSDRKQGPCPPDLWSQKLLEGAFAESRCPPCLRALVFLRSCIAGDDDLFCLPLPAAGWVFPR